VKSLATLEQRAVCERHLQARLYLYDRLLRSDTSALPPEVSAEITANNAACLLLLLHVQWLLGAGKAGSAPGTIKQLFIQDESVWSPEFRGFLNVQLAHLVLDGAEPDFIEQWDEASKRGIELEAPLDRILELARIVRDFQAQQPQATVASLRRVTGVDGGAAAALYLLARVYEQIALPLEEKESYSQWRLALAKLHGCSVSELAGRLCTQNPSMERAILTGVDRWLQLLQASGAQSDVNEVVSDFEKAGYTREFSALKVDRERLQGYLCRFVSKDDAGKETELQAQISQILTTSELRGACLIVRDEGGTDLEKLPPCDSVTLEAGLLALLPEQLSQASLMVLHEIVTEDASQNRKWVICYDQSEPRDALAIGLLPLDAELSVVYARAVVFDTRLDSTKDEAWLRSTTKLAAKSFDAQKSEAVRGAVRRIADQISPAGSMRGVTEL